VEISEGISGDIRGDEWKYRRVWVEISEGISGDI
jgi:hypothetical protein